MALHIDQRSLRKTENENKKIKKTKKQKNEKIWRTKKRDRFDAIDNRIDFNYYFAIYTSLWTDDSVINSMVDCHSLFMKLFGVIFFSLLFLFDNDADRMHSTLMLLAIGIDGSDLELDFSVFFFLLCSRFVSFLFSGRPIKLNTFVFWWNGWKMKFTVLSNFHIESALNFILKNMPNQFIKSSNTIQFRSTYLCDGIQSLDDSDSDVSTFGVSTLNRSTALHHYHTFHNNNQIKINATHGFYLFILALVWFGLVWCGLYSVHSSSQSTLVSTRNRNSSFCTRLYWPCLASWYYDCIHKIPYMS